MVDVVLEGGVDFVPALHETGPQKLSTKQATWRAVEDSIEHLWELSSALLISTINSSQLADADHFEAEEKILDLKEDKSSSRNVP